VNDAASLQVAPLRTEHAIDAVCLLRFLINLARRFSEFHADAHEKSGLRGIVSQAVLDVIHVEIGWFADRTRDPQSAEKSRQDSAKASRVDRPLAAERTA
jgi:hypothetical protein